jgi:hypothetical protein
VKNNNKHANKKQKKINKIKDQLAQLRAKLKASENKQSSLSSMPKLKKIKVETKQSNNKNFKVITAKKKVKDKKKKQTKIIKIKKKAKDEKKKQDRIKAEAKKKAKQEKKKQDRIKAEAKKKAKQEKKKQDRIKAEAKKKAKEEKKKQDKIKAEERERAKEEARKKEEELKRTYEEELEEQLTEEEIAGFQLEKIDMDKMCNRVCEIIAGYENQGTLQSELWKKLKLSSRDGSRLALKLERMGMITREKILEKERWTYKLIIKKIPISTKSIEGGPCLTCPVETKCSIDGEISPRTCQWIEDWVMIELKNK